MAACNAKGSQKENSDDDAKTTNMWDDEVKLLGKQFRVICNLILTITGFHSLLGGWGRWSCQEGGGTAGSALITLQWVLYWHLLIQYFDVKNKNHFLHDSIFIFKW